MTKTNAKPGVDLPRWVLYVGGLVVFLVVGGLSTYVAFREKPYPPLPADYFKTHPQKARRLTTIHLSRPDSVGGGQPRHGTTAPATNRSE